MRELGVRIDTPISALLTLNPRRVLLLFVSYSPVQSELHSTALSTHTHTRTHTHTHTHTHTRALGRSQLAECAAVAVGQGLAGAASASSAAPDAQRDEGGEEAPAEQSPLLG